MALRRVQISDFRCLRSVEVQFDPKFTLFSGPNASGKTSLLEAIYVLGRGRSFRTRKLEQLIRAGRDRFVVFGETVSGERHVNLGIEGSSEGTRARMAGERVQTLGELAVALPVQIIDPEVHRLIEEGPFRRRQFLDWGVFHVEHEFLGVWQSYQRVLKQRNSALRLRQAHDLVTAWDSELLRLGTIIDRARLAYVARLAPVVAELASNLTGSSLSIGYRPGWAQDTTFESALRASWPRDQESGVTHVGPHRADLSLRLGGAAVKDRISRGQQKLLAAALLIAQIKLFPQGAAVPTLLLDDPAAELDDDRLARLIGEVRALTSQLVVTSLKVDFSGLGTAGAQFRLMDGQVLSA